MSDLIIDFNTLKRKAGNVSFKRNKKVKKLKWKNLLKDKCPICNTDLIRKVFKNRFTAYRCKNCSFLIDEDKFLEIHENMTRNKYSGR